MKWCVQINTEQKQPISAISITLDILVSFTLYQHDSFIDAKWSWHFFSDKWSSGHNQYSKTFWKNVCGHLKTSLEHFEYTELLNTFHIPFERKGKINVLLLYFHRYLRLTPLLAVLILIAMSLYRFIGNGPIWPNMFNEVKITCDVNWWLALLYIQNYGDPKGWVVGIMNLNIIQSIDSFTPCIFGLQWFSVSQLLGTYQLICSFT